ncbi:MAG: hypothetical protein HC918_01525 [Oscillatoriales cyanobacterium SM2_1_8]|nr:hypothetical protein [Oscillatoriales cyanobacterium SM2_1_8]
MPEPQLTLHFDGGAITLKLVAGAARELETRLNDLASQWQPGPRRSLPVFEYRYTGEVFLELFCNPNLWPSPFAAKVLLAVRDDRLRLSQELMLPQLLTDLEVYLQSVLP